MLGVSQLHGFNVIRDGALNMPGVLVAVGTASGNQQVMTSPDGINWTGQDAAEANSWYSVCWNSALRLYCAVSGDGTNRVMTSPDGVTWTAQAAASASLWRHVTSLEEGGFFACGTGVANATTSFMKSADGVTWENVTADAHKIFNAALMIPKYYGDEVNMVAVSDDGGASGGNPPGTLRCSLSGKWGSTTWTAGIVQGSDSWNCICLADQNDLILIGGAATLAFHSRHIQQVFVDPDTYNVSGWGFQTPSWGGDPNTTPLEGSYGFGKFDTTPGDTYRSIAFAPILNRAVAVASAGAGGRVASIELPSAGAQESDLNVVAETPWTERAAASAQQWYGVTWSPYLKLFVAVAASGAANVQVMTSTDGIAWTSRTSGADTPWRSVCWGTPR